MSTKNPLSTTQTLDGNDAMKYRIVYHADCEGDWFSDADLHKRVFATRKSALAAAEAVYRGADVEGNEASWDAVEVNVEDGVATDPSTGRCLFAVVE